jgi:hypothetical protein
LTTADLFPWERSILELVTSDVGSALPFVSEVERVGNPCGYFADFHPADSIWTPDRRDDLRQASVLFELNNDLLVGAVVNALDGVPLGMEVYTFGSDELPLAVRSYRLTSDAPDWR